MIDARSLSLYLIRAIGGFALAKALTRRRLRILCYHGLSIGDEYRVAPHMFMRADTFERRMKILKKRGLPVIPLDEAVSRLKSDRVTRAETTITFDDGWASNLSVGLPILQRYGFPACVYVTTEHLAAGSEVFNVVLSYLVRTSSRRTFMLHGVHPLLDGNYDVPLQPDGLIVSLIVAAEKAFSIAERQEALRPIAHALGFDLDEVLKHDRFRLLTKPEILQLYREGVDVELHTHTHRLPDSLSLVVDEVTRNRDAVFEITGHVAKHFCYPSGEYSPRHPEWLAQLEILSATTCDPGLNGSGSSPLLLKRFLDSESCTDIAFEAEVCGLRELARAMRVRISRIFPRRAPPLTS